MKNITFLSILSALIIGSIAMPANANLLNNQGFERGSKRWSGTTLNYFKYACSRNNVILPKDGNCYAFFDDASGTSLFQHDTNKHSGSYEASVAVNGQDSVRFVIWTFCPGAAPQYHGFCSAVKLDPETWKVLKVRTSSPISNCEVKWELYFDTDNRVRVDAARLYQTF